MNAEGFVHLHLHSQYSLLDGAIKIGPLLDHVKSNGMNAVAVTDHGGMFGTLEFYTKARAQGIKPIIGCEVYVAPGSRFDKKNAQGSSEASYHLVLLCETLEGYRNLCYLVSQAYREGFYYKPRIDWNLLKEHHAGLIALTACLGGEIPVLLRKGNYDQASARVQEIAEIFDNNRLYLELQENYIPEQEPVNVGLKRMSKELNLPLVATNDCHYLKKEDSYAHEVLLCIQTGKTMEDPKRMRFSNDEFYVKSPEEMKALFSDTPEAITNTLVIADRCNIEFNLSDYHFPQYEKPEGKSLDEVLEDDSRRGLDERLVDIKKKNPDFSDDDEQTYRDRLETELECIRNMGFPGYFLIVADFINWAKDNDIPVGPGRGSAAGSLVAFSVRITDIDPIPYNLLFERFLNPERISMPDIDVDFCIYGREKVIAYVRDKYGAENVAQIITFGTMSAKSVIRDVGRALGMAYGDVDRISKLIPSVISITLNDALSQEPKLRDAITSDPKVAELMRVAMALEGLTRHVSTHAAGVVVTPDPLTNYLPLYVDQKLGAQVTQFSMNYVEQIGLVKFDFLGLKNLTVIDNALRLIREGANPDFDLDLIDDDDPKTYELLSRGETTGVFQLESSGMREYLNKLKPSCFEDLIAMVALYRPGPLGSGMVDSFIRRKHGLEKVVYDFPQLQPILDDTYGVIVYQEQVMLIAQVLGNYSLGGADLLRRAMGKKKAEEMAKQKEIFLAGAKENNLDPKKAEGVFDLMEKFAAYGFNKSHSAAYALVSYHTGYLKAHYPVEFMAALLTEDMENTDKVIKNISDVRSMGVEVLPPDVNESSASFTVHGKELRFGLGAVKGVGAAALEAIIEERAEGGVFSNLYNFCERVDLRRVNKKVIEALIKCGAFDSIEKSRSRLVAGMEEAVEISQRLQKEKDSGQVSLFGTEEVVSRPGSTFGELPQVDEWSDKVRLAFEKEALGFFITGHPLSRYQDTIRLFANCDTARLNDGSVVGEIKICGIPAALKEITTKKGDRMGFLTLEDLLGSVEIVIFSDVYATSSDYLKMDEPILISGTVEGDEETVKILAKDIRLLSQVRDEQISKIFFSLDATVTDEKILYRLKEVVQRHRGNCQGYVRLGIPNHSDTLIKMDDTYKVAASDEMLEDVEKIFGYNVVTFE